MLITDIIKDMYDVGKNYFSLKKIYQTTIYYIIYCHFSTRLEN